MRSEFENEMWEDDVKLFASMKDNYLTPNERVFFEQLFEKQTWDCSLSGDLLMSEKDNEDRLFLMRTDFEEYSVGKYDSDINNLHTMNLSQVLAANLKDCGFLQRDVTLWQWLRERDYKGIRYDHNYDDM